MVVSRGSLSLSFFCILSISKLDQVKGVTKIGLTIMKILCWLYNGLLLLLFMGNMLVDAVEWQKEGNYFAIGNFSLTQV